MLLWHITAIIKKGIDIFFNFALWVCFFATKCPAAKCNPQKWWRHSGSLFSPSHFTRKLKGAWELTFFWNIPIEYSFCFLYFIGYGNRGRYLHVYMKWCFHFIFNMAAAGKPAVLQQFFCVSTLRIWTNLICNILLRILTIINLLFIYYGCGIELILGGWSCDLYSISTLGTYTLEYC